MKRYCPNCKSKIEDGKKFCGNCGFNISDFEDVTAKQSKRKSRVIYIVLICVTLCIIGIVVAFSIQNNRHEPTTIDNDEEYEVVTDETPSPTEEPGRSFNVGYTTPFVGDIAWIDATDPLNDESYYFLINKEGRALGYVKQNIYENIIADTNGIIASPNSLGYTSIAACGNGYTFVVKNITDPDHNEYHFGIVNSEGKWEMEPTSLVDKKYIVHPYAGGTSKPPSISYVGDGIFQFDKIHFYNTNTHSWFDVPDVQDEANFVDGVTIVSNLVIHSDGSYSKLNVSGELDSFSDGVVFNKTDYKLYNVNGQALADLGYYKGKLLGNRSIIFNDGYAKVEFKGEDEQYYFVVIDKSGNQMFTPIKSGGNTVGIIRYNRFSVINNIGIEKIFDEHGNEIAEVEQGGKGGETYESGLLNVDCNYIDVDGHYIFENGIINVEKEVLDKGEAL